MILEPVFFRTSLINFEIFEFFIIKATLPSYFDTGFMNTYKQNKENE